MSRKGRAKSICGLPNIKILRISIGIRAISSSDVVNSSHSPFDDFILSSRLAVDVDYLQSLFSILRQQCLYM